MICYYCMREKGEAAVCPHCGAQGEPKPLAHHIRPGKVIGGRYLVGRVLGEGGFGITYMGYYKKLDMQLAIKEYFPKGISFRNTGDYTVYAQSQKTEDMFNHGKERFLSEAKTLVRFNAEPGIVSVIDFVEENGTAYLIMEYLEGNTLLQYLKERGTISADEAFAMLKPVMRTLIKVHAEGIIHRDISPDNIMRLQDGQLKLMDFGSAKEYTDDQKSLSVMLKKGYAPCEQYHRKGNQGPWTDVYALCATIYRCITGKTPADSLDRLFDDDLIPPSKLGAAITPAQEQVLLDGMAVKQQDRCHDVSELIDRWDKASKRPDERTAHQAAAQVEAVSPVAVNPSPADPAVTLIADSSSLLDPEVTAIADSPTPPDPDVTAVADNSVLHDSAATTLADAPLSASRQTAVSIPKGRAQKSKKRWVIGVVAACAVIVITAVIFILLHAKTNPISDFEYEIDGDTVTITGYKGDQEEVSIPAEIKGKPVTKIGGSAFKECEKITAVSIPDSVETISDWAFSLCNNLTSVKIPDSVKTIGKQAFRSCRSLTSVKIPNSVKTIGNNAFMECTSLSSVKISNSVKTIEGSTFCDCTSLTSVEIPNSVETIGFAAFKGCTSLTSVKIPNSVTYIESEAFLLCDSLDSVDVPDSCELNDFRSPFDSNTVVK